MPTPANPNATDDAKKVLNWLYQLPDRSTTRVISGQHLGSGTGSSGGVPGKYDIYITDVYDETNKWLAMCGADFAWGDWDIAGKLETLVDHWDAGGLIEISCHWYNPWTGNGVEWTGGQFYDRDLDGGDISDLYTPPNDAYTNFHNDLDVKAGWLDDLQTEGVVVLFRLFHEMNAHSFAWWSYRTVAKFVSLWQHVFDYFTTTKGLNNLLWVYAPDRDDTWSEPVLDYWPGSGYVDIAGMDYYDDSLDDAPAKGYTAMLTTGKPFAITEYGPTGPEPDPDTFDYETLITEIEENVPETTYFLSWNENWAIINQLGAADLLGHSWTITRDEVDWAEAGVGDAMEFATGSYTGNGVDDRDISVIFEPDLVVVKGDGQYAVFSTSAMPADTTFAFTDALDPQGFANAIQSFSGSGFQIGTHASVNNNGTDYHWCAFKDNGGDDFAVGSYTGDGVDDRWITLGWRPEIAWVRGDRAIEADLWCRITDNVTDYSQELANKPADATNRIQDFNATGFQVGTNVEVNENGTTYYYCAWKLIEDVVSSGTYTGDGADNRDITADVQPSVVFVKNATDFEFAAFRTDTMVGDVSGQTDNSALGADMIQALSGTGFQVGTHNSVNGNGDDMVWMAFGEAVSEPPDPPAPPAETAIGASWATEELACVRPWRLVVPEAMINYVLNPSAEVSGNFAAVGGGTMQRSILYSLYGVRSYFIQTAADGQGGSLTLGPLSNVPHYVTLRMRGKLPRNWRWSLGDRYHTPELVDIVDGEWLVYGALFSASDSNGSTTLYIRQSGVGTGGFNIDGVQVEPKTYWTTYCDGDQEGCEWNGTEHASTSSRSAQSRAGGRPMDFWEDYGFMVEQAVGAGAAEVDVGVRGYAFLPGGVLTGIKTRSRQFTLTGKFVAGTERELHANRQALLKVLAADTYPDGDEGPQPLRLLYRGSIAQKQIAAHYEGGLEGRLKASYGDWQVEGDTEWRKATRWTERAALRFRSPDPFWYQCGEDSVVLDTNDNATLRYCAGRLRSTGQWDDLGLTANPVANGTIYAMAISPDGLVYIGGDFTGWDNVANRDYIAAYNPSTNTWSTVGPGASVNDTVRALEFGPDGILYIGGDFLNLGGADGDKFSSYDPSTDTFNTVVAGPAAGLVYALTFGLDGTLYIGGSFTNWGDADGDRIVSWDGAALSSLGTGMDSTVYCLGVGTDGTIYAGGNFTTAGGNAVDYIAQWDGTSWSALGSGLDDAPSAIATGPDGTIYTCGWFTTAGGNTVNYIAKWNGTSWSALGSGLSTFGRFLDIGDDGFVYVSGQFTAAGGITLADRVAKWNGASWAHLDVNLPGTPIVRAIIVNSSDPVILRNYDLFIGFDGSGTGYFAGAATVTNDGTVPAYPVIVFERSGGTSATIYQVRNETTGKELLFDYDLLDGERLTIDLRPTRKSITSSMFGTRTDAVLANSDFGTWILQPGDNQVTAFVAEVGGADVTAWMVWATPYRSFD